MCLKSLHAVAIVVIAVQFDLSLAQEQTPATAPDQSPLIAVVERFLIEANGEALEDEDYDDNFHGSIDQLSAGLLLAGELNCTGCHQMDDRQRQFLDSKQAPVLTEVGSRLRPEYYAKLLESPHAVKAGTTMPDMLGSLSVEKRRTVAAELAAFLASTSKPLQGSPAKSLFARGRQLFQTTGCLSCHNPQEDDASKIADSVPLGDLTVKYTLPGLKEFLNNPHAVRPSARMPQFGLKDDEALAISSYLLKSMPVEPNLRFAYYQGGWSQLPDFSELQPVLEGESNDFDITVAKRSNKFGLVFRGFLHTEKDGVYRIFLSSDDGSRILIDGTQVAENDEIHPMSTKRGEIELSAGVHEVTVEYFEGGGQKALEVEIEGGDLERQPLGQFVTIDREKKRAETPEGAPQFRFTDAMITSGKQHFVTYGCAKCHELKQGDRINPALAAIPLNEFGDQWRTAGCLSKTPNAATGSKTNANRIVPDYHLSDGQRNALRVAIDSLMTGKIVRDDAARIHHRMLAMNCYACHERNEFGGVTQDRQEFFTSDQQEMGDEGRLPPTLTGVGAKIRAGYLKSLLENGVKDRPYMMTKMPGFGGKGVELAEQLTKADKLVGGPNVETEIASRRLKIAGRTLAGEEGLSCIKCHKFGKNNATGIQAINLTTMNQRLREDWFIEYMIDPNRFRLGTRMPESFRKGKTQFPDLLDGDARTQIYAIWHFLEDGEKAGVPLGLQPAKLQLIPDNEPLIYRNFIEGAGTRAIAVGYPGKVNLAFDANNMRLALLWHGAFIDPSMHWNGRGQGFQVPLGDNILRFDPAIALAKLADVREEWPSAEAEDSGIRFRGYRFDDRRQPVFLYRVDGIDVQDSFTPIVKTSTAEDESLPEMRRATEFSGTSTETIYFRAAVGREIRKLEDGCYRINDDWQLQIKSAAPPLVRKSKGQYELLIPIEPGEEPTTIEQVYRW